MGLDDPVGSGLDQFQFLVLKTLKASPGKVEGL